jgi:hypothetical protein
MDVVAALGRLGGVADRAALQRSTSRQSVRRALASGRIECSRRGVCALPSLEGLDHALARTGGVRSHLTAALHLEWPVKQAPEQPMITVARTRRIARQSVDGITLLGGTVTDDELAAGVTDPVHTVIDCARTLPFDEALAVADSALRSRAVARAELLAAAEASPRTGRSRATRVVLAGDSRAANPFESVLRAIALDVPGLCVIPQLMIGTQDQDGAMTVIGRADLVDHRAGIVIEAESWEFHGSREAFERDVRRYTAMVRAGWYVVRFGWDEVMDDPDFVRAVLVDVVALAGDHVPVRLVR